MLENMLATLLLLFKLIPCISEIPCIVLSIFKTSLCKQYSTNIDKFSIDGLYPFVIAMTGLYILTLCNLYILGHNDNPISQLKCFVIYWDKVLCHIIIYYKKHHFNCDM